MGNGFNPFWVIPCTNAESSTYFAFMNSENFPNMENSDNDDEDGDRGGWRENSDVGHSGGVVVLSG